jgi:hypothetical protein
LAPPREAFGLAKANDVTAASIERYKGSASQGGEGARDDQSRARRPPPRVHDRRRAGAALGGSGSAREALRRAQPASGLCRPRRLRCRGGPPSGVSPGLRAIRLWLRLAQERGGDARVVHGRPRRHARHAPQGAQQERPAAGAAARGRAR